MGGAGLGRLGAVSIPILENSHVDIDYNSVWILPSGSVKVARSSRKVEKKSWSFDLWKKWFNLEDDENKSANIKDDDDN